MATGAIARSDSVRIATIRRPPFFTNTNLLADTRCDSDSECPVQVFLGVNRKSCVLGRYPACGPLRRKRYFFEYSDIDLTTVFTREGPRAGVLHDSREKHAIALVVSLGGDEYGIGFLQLAAGPNQQLLVGELANNPRFTDYVIIALFRPTLGRHQLSGSKPERDFHRAIRGPIKRSHIGDLIVIAENEAVSSKERFYLLRARIFGCVRSRVQRRCGKADRKQQNHQPKIFPTRH